MSASAPAFWPVVKADGSLGYGQAGLFRCSMYWRATLMGAPSADLAKYDQDHSRFARR
jgi:hypothetical protein